MTQQPPDPWLQHQQGNLAPQPPAPNKRHRWPWITGGAVVIIVIIAVATSNGGGSKSPGNTPATTTAAPAAHVVAPTTTAAAPITTSAPTVLYAKSGSGTGSTPNFTTGGEWQIQWTYNCANFGQSGNFVISASDDTDFQFPSVDQLGESGADTTYVHDDPGTHALNIDSECNWTIKVLS